VRPTNGALWPLLCLAAVACDDPLKRAEEIESVRVLAARVEVEGDPQRAAPNPGENARVRWLVAAPEEQPALGWALSVCFARPNNVGLSGCAEPPFASNSAQPAAGTIALDFQVPPELPEAAERLAVLGAICGGEAPSGELDTADCPSGSGSAVSFELELAHEGDVNRNPAFGTVPLTFDGAPWEEAAASAEACRGSGLLEVPAGSAEHVVRVSVGADARDPLPRAIATDPEREELLISHFSDAPGLARPFSSLPADDESDGIDVEWRAPDSAAAGGERKRFWFVMRDYRGGSVFTERALCVIP
jgi:hypothetical protein